MLIESPDRAYGLRDSPSSARAADALCISTARAPMPTPPAVGIGAHPPGWRRRNNPGAQRRRLEACVAAYLRGLRTAPT